MTTLLQALLRNESGGRNIPNVHQGTSSGQAQGYFQITTGTWDAFGGRKYAPTPLLATKEQQADIASRIPLKRWDESTIARMRATGRPIDPNRTLGENLAMHGENAANFTPGTSTPLRHVGGAGSTEKSFSSNPLAQQQQPAATVFGEPLLYQFPGGSDYGSLADSLSANTLPLGGMDSGGSASPAAGNGGGEELQAPPAFESANPPQGPSPVSATPELAAVSPEIPLADIFTVKNFGQAGKIDPRTGGFMLSPGWGTKG